LHFVRKKKCIELVSKIVLGLYQGTTSVVPHRFAIELGFSRWGPVTSQKSFGTTEVVP
jgi:hypothetical protein